MASKAKTRKTPMLTYKVHIFWEGHENLTKILLNLQVLFETIITHFQVESTFTFINGEQSKNRENPPCTPHFTYKVHIFWEGHENLTKIWLNLQILFKTIIGHFQVESTFTFINGEQSRNRETSPSALVILLRLDKRSTEEIGDFHELVAIKAIW